jgi:CubicO group peptidase (beta-lactamase class C family)
MAAPKSHRQIINKLGDGTVQTRITRMNAFLAFSIALLATASSVQARDMGIAPAKPETVGFSSERLQRLEKGMQAYIDQKQLAGMVTFVGRHGKVVHEKTYGVMDLQSNAPIKNDSIVRIFSMTKPITGVAMMMLYEEGKWRINDPISRYIPEFKDLKVFAGMGADGKPILEAPKHPPTMGELMSHTAGFTYGLFGASPVDKMYQADNPLGAANLQEFINKLSKLPLAYQPGEGWMYSVSVDVQGYIVEKLSGKTLGEFMRERIFDPLGMKDSGFSVPADKVARVATIYNGGPNGLVPTPRDPAISKEPGLPQGGGGLYSTGPDYLRFLQMLANGGELDGHRLIAPSSVELMRTNRVSDEVRATGKFGIGNYRQQPGLGFGLDFCILEDPLKLGSTTGKGTYLWDGIAGTWFWVDPTNDIVFVGIIQRMMGGPMGSLPNIEDLSRQLVHQALVDPSK